MSCFSEQMPHTQLAWSKVLPWIACRFSTDINVMETTRKRLNNTMGSYLFTNGGGCIRYPHIIKSEQFVVSDGDHLTDVGNEVVLNTPQSALVNLEECLIFKDMCQYPVPNLVVYSNFSVMMIKVICICCIYCL
jgi:hypothetical protein